jgi:periplasmic divalent cation tolerance protein
MTTEKDPIIVLMTAKDITEAEKIAGELVKDGLAACVNIINKVRSIYKWQGAVCRETEVLCIIKTVSGNFEPLKEKIKSMHSYTVPEVIAIPIEMGSDKYLKWLVKETDVLSKAI